MLTKKNTLANLSKFSRKQLGESHKQEVSAVAFCQDPAGQSLMKSTQ